MQKMNVANEDALWRVTTEMKEENVFGPRKGLRLVWKERKRRNERAVFYEGISVSLIGGRERPNSEKGRRIQNGQIKTKRGGKKKLAG